MKQIFLIALLLIASIPLQAVIEEEGSLDRGLPEAAVSLPEEADRVEAEDSAVDLPAVEKLESKLEASMVPRKKGKWRWTNFVLGAVGGALVGAYLGFADAATPEGLDETKAATSLPLYAGIGALGGGLLGLGLGALVAPDYAAPKAQLPLGSFVYLQTSPQITAIRLGVNF